MELHRAEKIAVIGHGHSRHLLFDRDLHQLIDIAGPIEQGVIDMTVEIDEKTLAYARRGRGVVPQGGRIL
jgi:hypothetical protein